MLWESGGYPEEVEVPSYRKWNLEVRGNFLGGAGLYLPSYPVPIACLPSKAQDSYRVYSFRDSIASAVDAVEKAAKGSIQVSTGDLHVFLSGKVYRGYTCSHAWAEFSPVHIVELLNTVRNKVLDFSLALWKENPAFGDSAAKAEEKPSEKIIQQIFTTTVNGGTANLVGVLDKSVNIFGVREKDIPSLEQYLRENSVLEEDVQKLIEAINQDPSPSDEASFGANTSSWIATMMGKAASGIWKVGLNVAGSVLTNALMKYYGI